MTKAITKAQNLLNQKKDELNNIETAIDSLQDELIELEKSKITGEIEFDTAAVKENKKIMQEIATTKEVLETAKQRKKQILKENSLQTYKQAREIIIEYRKEKQAEHKADNLEIINAIELVREKVSEMTAKEKEYYSELKNFVDGMSEFLDPENVHTPHSNNTPHPEMLKNTLNSNTNVKPYYSILNLVNEREFLINGLIHEPYHSAKTEQEKARFK